MLKLKQVFRRRSGRIIFGLTLAVLVFHFYPLPNKLENRPYAKILLAENGSLLAASIAQDQQWRFPASTNLPEKYVKALLAFEDKYFYYHPGVNPGSILRAAKSNFNSERIVSGGSTLTMQVARLMREDPPRTYLNKLIEIFYAFKLEWHFSKNEILNLYASHAPFGGNTVGLSAASLRYFNHNLHGKSQTGMTWAEAALLAVLPNSPALIHPGRSRDKLLDKRNRLLKKLHQRKTITENEYKLSLLEKIPDKPSALPRIASQLLTTLTKQHRNTNIFHSTLNEKLQKSVLNSAQILGSKLGALGIHNLALVVIDNRKLETLAYIGNITSSNTPELYAKDLDIAVRPRSTGSILKPFLYALMLQEGMLLPETLVDDVPVSFAGFTPENYDHEYRGAVPAKQALAQSLNIPSVNMLKRYGTARFYDKLKDLGMTTLFRSPDDYGLSLILGGAEGNLWELTGMNAQLSNTAREGWKHDTHSNIKLVESNTLDDHHRKKILSQGSAWLTLDALIDVARPGKENTWREFNNSQKIAWKTGTSYGLRDAWAIGNSGEYTVGVWAGNASGEGIAGLSGLKTAAPVLFDVFNLLGHSRWLKKPEHALREVETCAADGYLSSKACASKTSLSPVNSFFQRSSPFQRKINLDLHGRYRVHGGCESVMNMLQETRLILPPLQEYYWRQNHKEYKPLPPWREDCLTTLANYSDDVPMTIIYPHEGSKIYIPRELSGKKGRVVFSATHRNMSSKLYWHINEKFIQQTELFHDIAVNIKPGWHKLVLVDENGFRLERWFKIL